MAIAPPAANGREMDSTPVTTANGTVAQVDVAIVGAGLAGSSIAAQLAAAGWQVLLLEQDTFPRHKVCGEFLSPEVQETLQRLDLYGAVATHRPAHLHQATITGRRGNRLTVTLPGTAWGLSRYALDEALAVAAAQRGAIVQSGSTVLDFKRQERGHRLTVRDSERRRGVIDARAVIMACGRHTRVGLPPRPPAAAGQQRGWRRCVGVKLHYTEVAMPPQTELYLLPGGYVGINPVEGGRANLCALLSYDAFAAAGKRVDTTVAQMMRWNPALAERLAGGVPQPESACTVAPVDTARRSRPWDEVACVGDTAAMIPPLCGDGMAMALHAATLCAPLADEFLRGRCTLSAWQERYSREWHAAFDMRLRVGRALQSVLGWPYAGDLLLSLGGTIPGLAGYFVRATRGRILPAWATSGGSD